MIRRRTCVRHEISTYWRIIYGHTSLACPGRYGILIRRKGVYRDDKYLFRPNSILVRTYLSVLIRCAKCYNNLRKARFAWFLVTIKPSRLIDSVASIQLTSIVENRILPSVRDSLLTLHGFLTATLCHAKACNYLCLLRFWVRTMSYVQVSSQLALNEAIYLLTFKPAADWSYCVLYQLRSCWYPSTFHKWNADSFEKMVPTHRVVWVISLWRNQ